MAIISLSEVGSSMSAVRSSLSLSALRSASMVATSGLSAANSFVSFA